MEKEIIETVLTEILDEQRQNNQLLEQNGKLLQVQQQILKALENKLLQQQEILQQKMLTSVDAFTKQLSNPTQPIKREFRILLFPEYGTINYYKVVFGRIFFWLVMLCIAKYAYLLGDKWLTERLENNKYQRAWETYYQQQNKTGQKNMQKILHE